MARALRHCPLRSNFDHEPAAHRPVDRNDGLLDHWVLLKFYAPALRYWGKTMCVAFVMMFAWYFYLYFRRIHLFADVADHLGVNVIIYFLGQTVVIAAVAVFSLCWAWGLVEF